jgi:Uma2 family endonuclease
MGYAQHQILLSEEEYLSMERNASFKSEFFNGQVYAMSGASIAHNNISGNIYAAVHAFLKNKTCRPYNSDQRIKIPTWPSFLYPDMSVACGNPEIIDKDNIANPVIIVEVLSPSTEEYDRTVKFGQYRQIASLKDYVLVSTKTKSVTKFQRAGDTDCWTEFIYDQPEMSLHLESIEYKLPLEEIYYNIELENFLIFK